MIGRQSIVEIKQHSTFSAGLEKWVLGLAGPAWGGARRAFCATPTTTAVGSTGGASGGSGGGGGAF